MFLFSCSAIVLCYKVYTIETASVINLLLVLSCFEWDPFSTDKIFILKNGFVCTRIFCFCVCFFVVVVASKHVHSFSSVVFNRLALSILLSDQSKWSESRDITPCITQLDGVQSKKSAKWQWWWMLCGFSSVYVYVLCVCVLCMYMILFSYVQRISFMIAFQCFK